MPLHVPAAYALVVVAFILLVSLPFATDYVGPDNDDTMRLVIVRDLLSGQGWFDNTQYRLGLAGGTPMHWSRLVDLPIANLISLFGLATGQERAEALALAVWPLLLTVPLLYGAGLAGLRIGGPPAMHAALVLTAVFAVAVNRFQPGSIDHHNVQLVLVSLLAAMLLDPTYRARSYGMAGFLSGLAIAIGAETVPLIGAACLTVALRWAWIGAAFRHAATTFGLSLAATVSVAFFATVAPWRYGEITCDSLSYGFYALSTFGGGILFLTVALASDLGRRGRFAALAGAGIAVAVAVLIIAPGCLRNPLVDLDPLLKTFWLSGVMEAQSAAAQFRIDPGSLGAYYGPGLLAISVCCLRIWRREAMQAHLVLMALILCSFTISLVQIRGAVFTNLLSAIPLAFAISQLRQAAKARPGDIAVGLGFAVMTIASVPASWAVAGLVFPGPSRDRLVADLASAASIPACTSRDAMAELAAEPAGVVAASSDIGAPVLRFTAHRVLSAPYHRNQGGMLTEIHIGLSGSEQAEAFLRGAGVTLLAFCPSDGQVWTLAHAEPEGLYAQLLASNIPAYLEPVKGATALRIFRLRPEDHAAAMRIAD